jgi:hypothetical protein
MDFVTRENIKRFRQMLSSETDPAKRETIKKLLKEAESKGRLAQ